MKTSLYDALSILASYTKELLEQMDDQMDLSEIPEYMEAIDTLMFYENTANSNEGISEQITSTERDFLYLIREEIGDENTFEDIADCARQNLSLTRKQTEDLVNGLIEKSYLRSYATHEGGYFDDDAVIQFTFHEPLFQDVQASLHNGHPEQAKEQFQHMSYWERRYVIEKLPEKKLRRLMKACFNAN